MNFEYVIKLWRRKASEIVQASNYLYIPVHVFDFVVASVKDVFFADLFNIHVHHEIVQSISISYIIIYDYNDIDFFTV